MGTELTLSNCVRGLSDASVQEVLYGLDLTSEGGKQMYEVKAAHARARRKSGCSDHKDGSKRFLRWGFLLFSAALVLAACGGSDEVLEEASDAVEAVVSDEIDDAAEETPTAAADTGSRPVVIEFGESYTIAGVEGAAPMMLTVPAGSVTVLNIDGDAANQSSASLTATAGFFATVQPGESTVSDPLITAAGQDTELVFDLQARVGDSITFTFENTPQTELPDGGDAPETITDAPLVEGTVTGLLGGDDSTDIHRFAAAPGDVLTLDFETSAESAGSVNYSWEFNGDVKTRGSAAPGAVNSESVIASNEQGGDWFLRITGIGEYSFTVTAESQNEAGSGTDAGADIATAVAASPGTINGWLGGDDSGDIYAVELPAGAVVNVGLSAAADGIGSVHARLLDNGSEVGRVSAAVGGSDEIVFVLAGDAATGHIEVWGSSNYELTLEVGTQQEAPGGGDAGDSPATAVSLELPATVSGVMSALDSTDFYSFIATGSLTTITMTAEEATSPFNFRGVLNGSEIDRANAGPGNVGTLDLETVAGELIVLELWSGRGEYELVVDVLGVQGEVQTVTDE